MKKKPRFFCDNCGYEVGSEVKACPYCARIFASIRCPACDYSGPDRMFQNGCPMCGYSAPPPEKTKQRVIKHRSADNSPSSPPLPFWMYIAAFIGLIILIAFLSYFITK